MRRKSKKAPVPDRQILLSDRDPEQELFTVDIQFVHGIVPFSFYFAGINLLISCRIRILQLPCCCLRRVLRLLLR